MTEKCGCCNGIGKIYMYRLTTGPAQIEDCTNCNGSGFIFSLGTFLISFKRNDELPKVKWKI